MPGSLKTESDDNNVSQAKVRKPPLQRENPMEATPPVNDNDVVIVATPPAVIIDLTAETDDQLRISLKQQRLIDAVQRYPQLYDTQHPKYWNYQYRGMAWRDISDKLNEEATKLMQIWLQLQTRYEWELTYKKDVNSQLKNQLKFLEPHMSTTYLSVCKMSLYLRDAWFDPIAQYRSVLNLINVLKACPELMYYIVGDYRRCNYKHAFWQRVSAKTGESHQCCEVTWLLLRTLYKELAEMRKAGYQLRDEWYFENIMGSLYKIVAAYAVRRGQKRPNPSNQDNSCPTPPKLKSPNAELTAISYPRTTPPQPVPKLPLAIVYPLATKSSTSTSTSTTSTSTASNNTNRVIVTTSGNSSVFSLPRITAISDSVTSDSVTSDSVTSDSVTSDSVTSNSVTSDSVKPKDPPPTIKIEFFDCPVNGRMLYAIGNGRAANLNMPKLAVFIREVMAIPQLHSKDSELDSKIDDLWLKVSKKFRLQDVVCRAIWTFLANNFKLFPQIAPMAKLMRPFKTKLMVWEKSHRLFGKFDEIARKHNWMVHKMKLPALMQLFEKYEHLYADLRKPRPGESTSLPLRQYTKEEQQEVWRVARERFPFMNHRDVWAMFKFAFETFMKDLERGIENPWPKNWWHALKQLRFLINVRYHPLEPYYYIVHNKFMEEVKRCSIKDTFGCPTNVHLQMPWETEEAKHLFVGELSQYDKKVDSVAADVTETQQDKEEQKSDQDQDIVVELVDQKQQQTQPMDSEFMPVAEPAQSFKSDPRHPLPNEWTRPKNDQDQGIVMEVVDRRQQKTQPMDTDFMPVAEPSKSFKSDPRPPLPNVDAYELTRLLCNEPRTHDNMFNVEKRLAWLRISKKLKTTVTDCRLSLQYALREQRMWKIRDPSGHCSLSAKYFGPMTDLYNKVMETYPGPTESEVKDALCPTRYIPDINMFTCKPSLVVKNWSYAVGTIPLHSQALLCRRLHSIFAKYAKLAKGEDCPSQVESNCNNDDILSISDVTSSDNIEEEDS
ncbi:uncharacterized protein LOC117783065 [Drosophila innubila]|uniref:uncharacterized protein LOC117783065 n=1 Tax=Drosophila innubila TaxID=198719 RepID=UPI00148E5411|nr:uncharacterized protein LOC117783065 [Drosophila innubila]